MSRPVRIYVPGPGGIVLAELPDGGPAGRVPFLPVDANILSPRSLFPAVSGGLEPTVNGDVNPDGPFVFKGFASTINFISTADLSAARFMVEGLDIGGNSISEEIIGPNSATTLGTLKFARIDSITANIAYGNLQIVNGALWRSNFIRGDYDRKYWNATVQLFCDLNGETPFNVYATGWPIPNGVFDPDSVPGTVIIDGTVIPIPLSTAWALQQQVFPVTAIWMETTAASAGLATSYFNLVVLQQGVKA